MKEAERWEEKQSSDKERERKNRTCGRVQKAELWKVWNPESSYLACDAIFVMSVGGGRRFGRGLLWERAIAEELAAVLHCAETGESGIRCGFPGVAM